jgi:hypothetical protein
VLANDLLDDHLGQRRDDMQGIAPPRRGDEDDEIINPYIHIVDDVCRSGDDRQTYPGQANLQGQATGRPFSA